MPQKNSEILGSRSYYDTRQVPQVETLASNLVLYQYMLWQLSNLRERAGTPEQPPAAQERAVLGGFYPVRDSIEAFQQLATSLGLTLDQLRYLDINEQPRGVLSTDELPNFVRADLSQLDKITDTEGAAVFPPGSVRLLVLDYTTHFMKPDKLATFLGAVHTVLAPDGVCMLTTTQLMFDNKVTRFFSNMRASLKNTVRVHAVPVDILIDLSQQHDLKVSLDCEFLQPFGNRMLALSRSDSPLPSFRYKKEITRQNLEEMRQATAT